MEPASIALLFPGQGSQVPGMGRDFAEACPQSREIYDQADDVLGRSISQLCFEGSEEDLRRTVNTQPALYVTSAAALAALRVEGIRAGFAAGHSLGEYTALYAAGSLDFATGLRLVQARAEAMEQAGRNRPGTMAAVLGLDDEAVEQICRDASGAGVVVAANKNSPGQVVLSGEPAAVERAIELAKTAGAKRAIALTVGGAFHSPLMAEAADMLGEALSDAEITPPQLKFVANASAMLLDDPEKIRSSLLDQLTSCVRWSECVQTVSHAGARRFIEIGPGKVLTGLLRRIDRAMVGANLSNMSDMDKVSELS